MVADFCHLLILQIRSPYRNNDKTTETQKKNPEKNQALYSGAKYFVSQFIVIPSRCLLKYFVMGVDMTKLRYLL